MSPDPCTCATAVAIHLRELPSTALIEAVSAELVARHPKHLRP